jgi:class 3 adenylate cyclase
MMPGQKVVAVFGFCDIRQFTGITECLEEDIMVFVNQIGAILHSDVHHSGGAPNKNIGDAFLFVWKLQSNYSGIESLKTRVKTVIAENSVGCFIKCALHIKYSSTHGALSTYKHNPSIKERFGADSRSNFNIRLGFGLHVGWAIEGAIGSRYKIDVSYLSPHVNIAARLEAATKQYMTDILFSSNLFDLLSMEVQDHCRRIDRVMVKGSAVPMDLYTFDIGALSERQLAQLTNSKRLRLTNNTLNILQNTISSNFFELYQEGLDLYLSGRWSKAVEYFSAALSIQFVNAIHIFIHKFLISTSDISLCIL